MDANPGSYTILTWGKYLDINNTNLYSAFTYMSNMLNNNNLLRLYITLY